MTDYTDDDYGEVELIIRPRVDDVDDVENVVENIEEDNDHNKQGHVRKTGIKKAKTIKVKKTKLKKVLEVPLRLRRAVVTFLKRVVAKYNVTTAGEPTAEHVAHVLESRTFSYYKFNTMRYKRRIYMLKNAITRNPKLLVQWDADALAVMDNHLLTMGTAIALQHIDYQRKNAYVEPVKKGFCTQYFCVS